METRNPKYEVLETQKMHVVRVELKEKQNNTTSTKFFQFDNEQEMHTKIELLNQRKELTIVDSMKKKEIIRGMNLQLDKRTQNMVVFPLDQFGFENEQTQYKEQNSKNKKKLIAKVEKSYKQSQLMSEISMLKQRLKSKDKIIQQNQKNYKQQVSDLNDQLQGQKKKNEQNTKQIEKIKGQLTKYKNHIEQSEKIHAQQIEKLNKQMENVQQQKTQILAQIHSLRAIIQSKTWNHVEIARLRVKASELQAYVQFLDRQNKLFRQKFASLGVVILQPTFWNRGK